MKKKLITVCLSILIIIFVLLSSTQIVVLSDDFFNKQYINNNVINNTQIEIDELMEITDEIQKYLFDDREDFLINGIVNGQEQQVFNTRETIHMADVKKLFKWGVILRNISFLLIITISFFVWKKDRKVLYRSFLYSFIVFIIIGILISILLTSDFNKYFNIFHEILFYNDYWMLDSNNSVLINMLPLDFFINISIRIGAVTASIILLLGVIGYLKIYKKGGKYVR
ncbi:MAG: TIGR01906 family membrane protein [Eubacteriaceae bacterium]